MSEATDKIPEVEQAKQEFGRFQLRGEISRGGMGIVYRAYDPEREQLVALKVMRVGAPSSEELSRFELEMRATAELDHPNIIHVFDSGEVRGQPYYTMELIDGDPLGDLISRQVLTRERTCLLAIQIAEALQHAHTRGLLHRDLKPSNVLVSREGGDAKLFDFGLARELAPDASRLTESGFVVGTPNYMSPEQARGERVASPASDLFSLGALFYEMLTGEMAFPGTDGPEVLRRVTEEDPLRPTVHDPSLEHDLEVIILKALNKEPDERYLSAAVFAQDIRNVLERRRTIARPPGPLKRMMRILRRHRERAYWIAALSLVSAAIWLYHELVRRGLEGELASAAAQKQHQLQIEQTLTRERDAARGEAALLRGQLLAPSQPSAAERAFRQAMQLAPERPEPRAQLAEVLLSRARADLAARRLPPALRRLREAVALAPQRVEPQRLLARSLLDAGRVQAAERRLQALIRSWPDDAAAHRLFARLLVEGGRLDAARKLIEEAMAAAPDHPESWLLRGRLALAEQRDAAAAGAFGRSLELAPSWDGYHHRAVARLRQRRFEDALRDCGAALELRSDDGQTLLLRAAIYRRIDEPARARADLERVLEVESGLPLRDAIHQALAYNQLERYEEALEAVSRWLALAPRDPEAYRAAAHLQRRRGDRAGELMAWRELLRIFPGDSEARRRVVALGMPK